MLKQQASSLLILNDNLCHQVALAHFYFVSFESLTSNFYMCSDKQCACRQTYQQMIFGAKKIEKPQKQQQPNPIFHIPGPRSQLNPELIYKWGNLDDLILKLNNKVLKGNTTYYKQQYNRVIQKYNQFIRSIELQRDKLQFKLQYNDISLSMSDCEYSMYSYFKDPSKPLKVPPSTIVNYLNQNSFQDEKREQELRLDIDNFITDFDNFEANLKRSAKIITKPFDNTKYYQCLHQDNIEAKNKLSELIRRQNECEEQKYLFLITKGKQTSQKHQESSSLNLSTSIKVQNIHFLSLLNDSLPEQFDLNICSPIYFFNLTSLEILLWKNEAFFDYPNTFTNLKKLFIKTQWQVTPQKLLSYLKQTKKKGYFQNLESLKLTSEGKAETYQQFVCSLLVLFRGIKQLIVVWKSQPSTGLFPKMGDRNPPFFRIKQAKIESVKIEIEKQDLVSLHLPRYSFSNQQLQHLYSRMPALMELDLQSNDPESRNNHCQSSTHHLEVKPIKMRNKRLNNNQDFQRNSKSLSSKCGYSFDQTVSNNIEKDGFQAIMTNNTNLEELEIGDSNSLFCSFKTSMQLFSNFPRTHPHLQFLSIQSRSSKCWPLIASMAKSKQLEFNLFNSSYLGKPFSYANVLRSSSEYVIGDLFRNEVSKLVNNCGCSKELKEHIFKRFWGNEKSWRDGANKKYRNVKLLAEMRDRRKRRSHWEEK